MEWTCQLTGEMPNESGDSTTCVPLRLAGLDVGIVWGKEDFQECTVGVEDSPDAILADLLHFNQKNPTKAHWLATQVASSRSSQNQRRRLEQDEDDDDDWVDYDEDGNYIGGDDFDMDEPEDHYPDQRRQRRDEVQKQEQQSEKRKALQSVVTNSSFSISRNLFLQKSKQMIDKIDHFLDGLKDNDDDEEGDGREEEQQSQRQPPSVDPVAAKMTRSELKNREERISGGFDSAVSAKILLGGLSPDGADWVGLASMSLLHSKVSTEGVWQILSTILIPPETLDPQTCASSLSIMCPPKTLERESKILPTPLVLAAGESACKHNTEELHANSCPQTSNELEIPESLPDGYYGYHKVEPRTDTDYLSGLAAPLQSTTDLEISKVLEDKVSELETQVRELENDISSLEDSIGANDATKFGDKGELHSLKDTCHDVTAGKYVYEVCIFGKAQQKDVGQSHGTSLGMWDRMTVDEEGVRTMSWTRGQKCWNGPERSATVHLRCGKENKVTSADEPDTCRYVLEMESYIACDEPFYQRHIA